jgi:hypothetical protein
MEPVPGRHIALLKAAIGRAFHAPALYVLGAWGRRSVHMTVIRHGRSLAAYARESNRVTQRRPRDKDARLLLQVFQARRAEGPEAFAAWYGTDPAGYQAKLRAAIASADHRAARRAAQALLWLCTKHAEVNISALSEDEAAEVESWLEEYEAADHGGKRALRWRAGLTKRQGRASRARSIQPTS